MAGPVCRSESKSAPAEPADFSWHLAAKKKIKRLINTINTHICSFVLSTVPGANV